MNLSKLIGLFGVLFAFGLLLSACDRQSKEELELRQCLADQSATGEFPIASLQELEDTLLDLGALRSISRDDYIYLLRRLSAEEFLLSEHEVAPRVRDFWFLASPSTVNSFRACILKLYEDGTLVSPLFLRLHQALEQDIGVNEQTESEAVALANAMSHEEFDTIFNRSVLLFEVIRYIR